ncbi:MAG: hypothetical protein J6P56_04760 [Bacteroidales bacterium]|nr:hypothetical protein [Bacteroidales bacterium]
MKRSIFSLLAVVLLASACHKDEPWKDGKYYANTFAYNVMRTYYLWNDEPEVAGKIGNWKTTDDPVEKVKNSIYPADRWTALYEDYSAFESSVTGSGKTFGLEFQAYTVAGDDQSVIARILFTYADSPGRKAGLKRGDTILSVDGQMLTKDNYVSELTKLYYASSVEIGLADNRNLRLDAVEMYEDPVHTVSTFVQDGVKYGYLHFSNFTLDAGKDLEDAFALFKAEGVKNLVLDLRYNTGGYVITSTVLASMIAPPSVVSQEAVFNQEIYNSILSESVQDNTCFTTELTYTSHLNGKKVTLKPLDVNPGIEHLWVLVSKRTASASVSLICGLKPYMDVTVVGERTSGKFCGGNLIKATDWYDSMQKNNGLKDINFDAARAALPKWGLYVITSRYADCNGVTLSMPDGIPADIAGKDTPSDGFELGDPSESMLATALGAVKSDPTTSSLIPVELPVNRPGFCVLLH